MNIPHYNALVLVGQILEPNQSVCLYVSRGHAKSSDPGTEVSLGVWSVSCYRIMRHEAILCSTWICLLRRIMWFHEKSPDESILDHSILYDLGLQTKHAISFSPTFSYFKRQFSISLLSSLKWGYLKAFLGA